MLDWTSAQVADGARDSATVQRDARPDLAASTCAELEALVESLGPAALPRHADLPVDLEARRHRLRADDRPGRELRAALADASAIVARPTSSSTTSRKTARRSSCCALADGRQIESVFIPDTPAQTFCVSTQVGCAMGCAFCLTGKMGLVRNLTAGEIAGQVRLLARALDLLDKSVQHRADGHGRAAAQLRRDDEGAADAEREGRAWRASASASRCRRSAWCR